MTEKEYKKFIKTLPSRMQVEAEIKILSDEKNKLMKSLDTQFLKNIAEAVIKISDKLIVLNTLLQTIILSEIIDKTDEQNKLLKKATKK